MLLPVSITLAQQTDEVTTFAFGGLRYNDGLLISYGIATQLSIGNLWTLEYGNFGHDYGDVSAELVYIARPTEALYLGLLAGPNPLGAMI